MALQKSVETKFGIVANYHCLTMEIPDANFKKHIVYLKGYPSKEIKLQGVEHISIERFEIKNPTYTKSDDLYQKAYEWIKLNRIDWESAEDC